jgi:hypothetical protein
VSRFGCFVCNSLLGSDQFCFKIIVHVHKLSVPPAKPTTYSPALLVDLMGLAGSNLGHGGHTVGTPGHDSAAQHPRTGERGMGAESTAGIFRMLNAQPPDPTRSRRTSLIWSLSPPLSPVRRRFSLLTRVFVSKTYP